jgi:hypothetical protein
MNRIQKFTTLFALTLVFLSCISNSTSNNSKDKAIFGVYEADWMTIRYYLYPDSTFYWVSGKTGLVNSEFDGPSTKTTYSLTKPDGIGTFTVLKEGENSIIRFNYKQYRGLDMTNSSRHKIENNHSFYSINENKVRETYNKVGGIDELIPK